MSGREQEPEIGRCKLFASDRMEFVTEGEDENGRKCWRTYTGMTKPNGEIVFTLQTLAYSPPNDWQELGLPGLPLSEQERIAAAKHVG